MVPPLMAAVVHLPLAADPTQVATVPGGAILLNESSGNREPDDLAGDEVEFEMQAGPIGTSGGRDEAKDDQDMADMLDFLL